MVAVDTPHAFAASACDSIGGPVSGRVSGVWLSGSGARVMTACCHVPGVYGPVTRRQAARTQIRAPEVALVGCLMPGIKESRHARPARPSLLRKLVCTNFLELRYSCTEVSFPLLTNSPIGELIRRLAVAPAIFSFLDRAGDQ